jgi:hypothetical protein
LRAEGGLVFILAGEVVVPLVDDSLLSSDEQDTARKRQRIPMRYFMIHSVLTFVAGTKKIKGATNQRQKILKKC